MPEEQVQEQQEETQPEDLCFDRYGGRVVGQAVSQSQKGYYQLAATCLLESAQERARGPYKALPESVTVTAYIMLSGSNGRNEKQCQALKDALGWDADEDPVNALARLQNTDYSEQEVSFKVGDEDDKDGNPVRRIQWINRRGVAKSSAKKLKEMGEGWTALGPQPDLPTDETPGEAAQATY